MKKLWLVLVALSATPAFALSSDLDVMKAVLASDSLNNASQAMQKAGFSELIKVEKGDDVRCFGCGQYTVTFRTSLNGQEVEKTAIFSTLEDSRGVIHVNLQSSQ